MNNYYWEMTEAFLGILKNLNVPKAEASAISCALQTEEMLSEAYAKIKAKNFDLTPKETMTICIEVIRKHQQ